MCVRKVWGKDGAPICFKLEPKKLWQLFANLLNKTWKFKPGLYLLAHAPDQANSVSYPLIQPEPDPWYDQRPTLTFKAKVTNVLTFSPETIKDHEILFQERNKPTNQKPNPLNAHPGLNWIESCCKRTNKKCLTWSKIQKIRQMEMKKNQKYWF